METIGFIGSLLLTFCGMPELIRTVKDRRCHLGWEFLLMWFFGEVFCFVYIFDIQNLILLMNYSFNLVVTGLMLIFKIKNFYDRR